MKGNTEKGITFIQKRKEEIYISYAQIYINIVKLASFLKGVGINKGEKVIFQTKKIENFIYLFWACILNEYYAIPLERADDKESKQKLYNVGKSLKGQFVLIYDEYNEIFHSPELVDIEQISIERFYETSFVDQEEKKEGELEQIAFIQFSSGSTGMPKGVMLSHNNLISNANAIIKGLEVKQNDSSLSWLPLSHDMGLIGFHITPTMLGINHVIMTPSSFVMDPLYLYDIIYRYKISITGMTCTAINHILNVLNRKKEEYIYNISSLKRILIGAEPISYSIVNEFIKQMKRYNLKDNVLFPVYGLAEGTLAVAFPKLNIPVQAIRVVGNKMKIGKEIEIDGVSKYGNYIISEGKCVEGVEIIITDDEGEVLSEGMLGHINVCGKNVAKFYLIDNEVIQATDKYGRLDTRDLGFVIADNLYVLGRESELVINGKNFYLSDAEQVIEQRCKYYGKHWRLNLVPIFSKNHYEVLIFLRGRYNSNIVNVLSKIKDDVMEQTAIKIDGVVFVDEIPITTSGKIKRFELASRYLEGHYGSYISLDAEYMKSSVEEEEKICLDLFQNIYGEKITVNQRIDMINNESFRFYMYICALNEYFQCDIGPENIGDCKTVKEISKLYKIKN